MCAGRDSHLAGEPVGVMGGAWVGTSSPLLGSPLATPCQPNLTLCLGQHEVLASLRGLVGKSPQRLHPCNQPLPTVRGVPPQEHGGFGDSRAGVRAQARGGGSHPKLLVARLSPPVASVSRLQLLVPPTRGLACTPGGWLPGTAGPGPPYQLGLPAVWPRQSGGGHGWGQAWNWGHPSYSQEME